MKTRVPLYAKIIGWFFLNLAAIVAASWLLLRDQLKFSALPARAAGAAMDKAAQQVLASIRQKESGEWDHILEDLSRSHGVEFRLVNGSGRNIAGARSPLPPEVHGQLFGPPRQGPQREPGDEGDSRRPPRNGRPGPGRRNDAGENGDFRPDRGPENRRPDPEDRRPGFGGDEFFGGPPPDDQIGFRSEDNRTLVPNLPHQLVVQSVNPDRYWVIARMDIDLPEFRKGAFLMATSDSPTGHGFFFDVTPYLWWGAGVLCLSVLIWFPFVRGLTRSISRMRATTASLAEGRFEAQAEERRRDEVGELGHEINRMARRLSGYVNGQKRFLGDVAHELSAPTARMQMGLAILEQRATTDADRERLADVREEAEHMGSLVNELLQFSRASVSGRKAELQPCDLSAIAEKAVLREAGDTSQVRIEVPENLRALADANLLLRALSNLLRNAIRYAGHAGPIVIKAASAQDKVQLSVEDSGPGIPPEALPRIFEPFYRLDTARTPGTGGTGLGLAIVQTCMEACGGSTSARNLSPGLCVTLSLSPISSAVKAELSAVDV